MTGKEFQIITRSAGETRNLGEALASFLPPGAILGLKGELGAGKTTLIQGICKGLGVGEKVISPTFVLMHLYKGEIPVFHFDLYRLEPRDFEDLGWEEYLEGKGVSVLEWIDRAGDSFPYAYLEVSIEYGDGSEERKIHFTPRGRTFPWLEEFFRTNAAACH